MTCLLPVSGREFGLVSQKWQSVGLPVGLKPLLSVVLPIVLCSPASGALVGAGHHHVGAAGQMHQMAQEQKPSHTPPAVSGVPVTNPLGHCLPHAFVNRCGHDIDDNRAT